LNTGGQSVSIIFSELLCISCCAYSALQYEFLLCGYGLLLSAICIMFQLESNFNVLFVLLPV